MFAMMLKPVDEPCLYLGVGTYYTRTAEQGDLNQDGWVRVELKHPLIMDSRRTHRLIQRYRTRGDDIDKIRVAAQRLSEEVLEMGHDGIIAVVGRAKDRQVMVVTLDRAIGARSPGAAKATLHLHAA